MTCSEIENRLLAYMEDLLTPGERAEIDRHLASCPRCARAFGEFKQTQRILKDLDEVEPPPFFEQRIMSLIRDEAGRKRGILARLFYPLHVKIPVQILATILVAFLALHVYNRDPEMRQMAPLPIPLEKAESRKAASDSATDHPASAAVSTGSRAPSGDPTRGQGKGSAVPQVERTLRRQPLASGQDPDREPSQKGPTAVGEKNENPVLTEPPDRQQRWADKSEGRAAAATPLREQRPAMDKAGSGTFESHATAPASVPPIKARNAAQEATTELTVEVGNTDVALRELQARVDQAGGRIHESRNDAESGFVQVEIPSRNYPALLGILEHVGRLRGEERVPAAAPDVLWTVTIRIVRLP